MVGVRQRPLCILVDEARRARCVAPRSFSRARARVPLRAQVDGAVGDAIATLISDTKHPPMRPIICTANELYVPHMRKLRACCAVVRVQAVAPQKLVQRLRYICKLEGMTVDTDALATLATSTDGDIRSCLNTLQVRVWLRARAWRPRERALTPPTGFACSQFLKRRHGRVTSAMIRTASVGHKDQEKNLLDVCGMMSWRGRGRGRGRGSGVVCAFSLTWIGCTRQPIR
jgi:hypothetical protein